MDTLNDIRLNLHGVKFHLGLFQQAMKVDYKNQGFDKAQVFGICFYLYIRLHLILGINSKRGREC